MRGSRRQCASGRRSAPCSCSRRPGAFAVLLYPALLALESLAACALAWGLYHRMSRARLGAALAPFRYFRFNDELIWALVAGMTITVLPALESLRVVGANLVVFFGALYALRGFGVIAWFYPQADARGAVGGELLLQWYCFRCRSPLAVGLGVTDTWIDWRRRMRTAGLACRPRRHQIAHSKINRSTGALR